jgi:hypothetical protein
MRGRLLLACLAAAIQACASGGSEQDVVSFDGSDESELADAADPGDGGGTTPARDSGGTPVDAANAADAAKDTSSPSGDGGGPAEASTPEASMEAAAPDGMSSTDSSSPMDAADESPVMGEDSGTPDSGSVGAVCPNNAQYALEAAAAAASKSPIFCPIVPNCPATDCCYEELMPLSICVAK